MTWLQGILQAHPEIAFFLVLGLGYLFGKLSLGSFKLGAVTGTLLAGVLVGQLGVTLPNEVKQCFFLLFLFAIGFRTGPRDIDGDRAAVEVGAVPRADGLLPGRFVRIGDERESAGCAGIPVRDDLRLGDLTVLGEHLAQSGVVGGGVQAPHIQLLGHGRFLFLSRKAPPLHGALRVVT